MLEGVESNRIIIGAYTDRHGGVCPMLAAHRNGGRTSLASFAHAWDGYTCVPAGSRAATERELNTLTAMLEASIMLDELPAPRRDTGERHRGASPSAGVGLVAASAASTSTSALSSRSRPRALRVRIRRRRNWAPAPCSTARS